MKIINKLYYMLSKKDKGGNPIVKPNFVSKPKRKVEMTSILPWWYWVRIKYWVGDTELEKCVIVQKNGNLQITYAFRGYDIESYSADYINAVFEYFNTQIKTLGDGWMVSLESQRFKMHDYPSADFDNVAGLIIDKERESEFRLTGDHYDSCYYMNFVYKPEAPIKKKFVKFFYTEPEVGINQQEEIKQFLKLVENMTSVLSSRLIIRPLTTEETIAYLHSTISFKRYPILVPDHCISLDHFIKDSSIDNGKTIRLGDYYCPILEINDFPTSTYPTILNELNKTDIEYRCVHRCFPIEKTEALKEIEKQISGAMGGAKSGKKMASEMMFGYESRIENQGALAAASDIQDLQVEVATDVNGLCYYNSSLMVWDKDYSKAIEKLKKIETVIERCQFTCQENEFGALDGFKGMIAGNTTANIRRPAISTGNFTHILPFSAIWAGIEHNKFVGDLTGIDKPLITCATNYGANFYLNLNDGDVGHTLILGPTGAGKSTLLNLIAASTLKYPDSQVFFMDYGLSSLTLTLAVGGSYINPADSTVCFQPLRDIDDDKEFAWANEFIQTIIALQGVKLNPRMRLAIEAAIRALTVLPKEMRTLTTFKMNLEYTDEQGYNILADAIAQYCVEGRYGHIFDGNKTSLVNARWVLFEMEHIMDLGPNCSAPAILFIFHYLEKQFTGKLTFFIMDECWFGLENEIIRSKMKEYLLTLRKKNVFCIFATQNPSAVADSPLASTMIQNCPTQIFLADPKARKLMDKYQNLGLSAEEVNILSMSQKKRDYYLKCTAGARLFQLSLGAIQLALFRGRESTFNYPKGSDNYIRWAEFQKYLLEKRKEQKKTRCYVDEILDVQGIPFRHYLKDYDWEKYL